MHLFKGSLTKKFRLQFFMNQFPPGPCLSHWDHLKFFMKIRGDIHNFCVDTGDKLFTGVNDTGNNRQKIGWCCWHRRIRLHYLKRQCHEIFDCSFSTWISFPEAPDYTIRAVSYFFENSRRYSELKVHHRCRWHWWQMEKNLQKNKKIFIISFGHLWVVELAYK